METTNQIFRHHKWSQVISVLGCYTVQKHKLPKLMCTCVCGSSKKETPLYSYAEKNKLHFFLRAYTSFSIWTTGATASGYFKIKGEMIIIIAPLVLAEKKGLICPITNCSWEWICEVPYLFLQDRCPFLFCMPYHTTHVFQLFF